MNKEKIMKTILSPHVSEKGTIIADKYRQFIFKIAPDATKDDVKKAVELLFKVKVEGVRVVNVKGKKKMYKQRVGQRKNWKKAYITLQEGEDIVFAGAEK